MGKKIDVTKGAAALLLVIFILWGCRSTPPPAPRLSCEQKLGQSLSEWTAEEIADFLDEGKQSGRTESCWTPLIKKCLDENREIPHRQVKLALKAFNQRQYADYFHKAVSRYFNDIIFGRNGDDLQYRPQDREFLIAYSRYCIRNCPSKNCTPLKAAKQICFRIDTELYHKLFEAP